MEHTDHHAERLLDALADRRVLKETLVLCIVGQRRLGRGDINGCFNEPIVVSVRTRCRPLRTAASAR